MKIVKGTTRLVLILPSLGIVLKFPRFYFGQIISQIIKMTKRGQLKTLVKWLKMPYDSTWIKRKLFDGLLANRREWRLSKKTKHPLLWPTLFSFFGLFNIQKIAPTGEINDFERRCYDIIGDDVKGDLHQFSPKNFCFVGDHLRVVDYGGPGIEAILETKGLLLFNSFTNQP